jgi:hypothetical protein
MYCSLSPSSIVRLSPPFFILNPLFMPMLAWSPFFILNPLFMPMLAWSTAAYLICLRAHCNIPSHRLLLNPAGVVLCEPMFMLTRRIAKLPSLSNGHVESIKNLVSYYRHLFPLLMTSIRHFHSANDGLSFHHYLNALPYCRLNPEPHTPPKQTKGYALSSVDPNSFFGRNNVVNNLDMFLSFPRFLTRNFRSPPSDDLDLLYLPRAGSLLALSRLCSLHPFPYFHGS